MAWRRRGCRGLFLEVEVMRRESLFLVHGGGWGQDQLGPCTSMPQICPLTQLPSWIRVECRRPDVTPWGLFFGGAAASLTKVEFSGIPGGLHPFCSVALRLTELAGAMCRLAGLCVLLRGAGLDMRAKWAGASQEIRRPNMGGKGRPYPQHLRPGFRRLWMVTCHSKFPSC